MEANTIILTLLKIHNVIRIAISPRIAVYFILLKYIVVTDE